MFKEYKTESKTALLQNYSRYPVEFVKGDGEYLFDKAGTRYLDFLSGIAVTGFGHNHSLIKSVVTDQIDKVWHTSNLFESEGQENLAKKLTDKSGLDSVFFCNSGTEANEAAIKFVRKAGGERTHIISAKNSFHGRTMGSLSATGQEKLWEGFNPMLPGFSFVKFGDIHDLESEYSKHKDETIAVMLEPIQGESGIIVPPEDYLHQVREFCNENNLFLILDEVQSGLGRTGKFFAHQYDNITPDIITIAKGIANGIPLGAVICSDKIGSEMKPGSHGSTFGGNPIAVAAANVVVDLIDEQLLYHIQRMGEMIRNSVEAIHTNKIKAVRGKGLMIGIEFVEGISAKEIAKELLLNGIVAGTSGDSVLRILPPFIINQKDIVQFTVALDGVLSISKNGF